MIYEDGPGADYRVGPMSLAIRQVEVTAAGTLTLRLTATAVQPSASRSSNKGGREVEGLRHSRKQGWLPVRAVAMAQPYNAQPK